jgi:outer membrane autotransporter protein
LGREVFETAIVAGQALDRHLTNEGSALWGQFIVRGSEQDALSSLADGYDSDQLIFAGGVDLLAARGVRAGLSASYADIRNQDLRGDTLPTETTDAQSLKLGAYVGVRLCERGFMNAELAYLTGSAETARSGVFGAIGSAFDFDGFVGRATIGYDLLPDENVAITPTIGVNFARVNFDDARESGGFDFLVERGDAEFAELRAGIELGARLSPKVKGLIGGTVVRDLEESTRSFRLSADQGPTFFAVLPLREVNRFELAATLSVTVSDTVAFDVGYHGDFNEGYQGHAARASVRIGF